MVMHPPSAINPDTGLPWSVKNDTSFGFVPTLWVCIFFVCLFSFTGLVHLYQSFRYRMKAWWIPTVVTCGLVEVLGWSGRIWGSQNVWSQNPYIMQIVCTIFGPSFMTAAFFIIFVRIIRIVGPEYSRLSPRICKWPLRWHRCHCPAHPIYRWRNGGYRKHTLRIGNRSTCHGRRDHPSDGCVFSIEYFWRVYKERPLRARQHSNTSSINMVPRSGLNTPGEPEKSYGLDNLTPNVKTMVFGLIIATVLVYIRSIYRTAELLDGWGGPIITNQTMFDLLDGVPVFLAMVALNIFHPGRLIPQGGPNDGTLA